MALGSWLGWREAIMIVADAVLVFLALYGWWGTRGRSRSFLIVVTGLLLLAGGYKVYHQVYRAERLGSLRAAIAQKIDDGEKLGDQLMKIRTDANVRTEAQRVERYREDVMKFFDEELPRSRLSKAVGTVPKDIPHDLMIDYVRRRLDFIIQNLRRALEVLHEHV